MTDETQDGGRKDTGNSMHFAIHPFHPCPVHGCHTAEAPARDKLHTAQTTSAAIFPQEYEFEMRASSDSSACRKRAKSLNMLHSGSRCFTFAIWRIEVSRFFLLSWNNRHRKCPETLHPPSTTGTA